MNSIAKLISKGDFDLYLLQELWMESDYEKIKTAIQVQYHITQFRNMWYCDGRLSPLGMYVTINCTYF